MPEYGTEDEGDDLILDQEDYLDAPLPQSVHCEPSTFSTNLRRARRRQQSYSNSNRPVARRPPSTVDYGLLEGIGDITEERQPQNTVNGAYPKYENGDEGHDAGPLDWIGDGPRKRVEYDDLTAIDWIFEYSKERQRRRMLYAQTKGLPGQALRLLDASTIWIILVLTGLASGFIAAGIDIVSDWLGDLKQGFCSAGVGGGRFYLNRAFCCWGVDNLSQCTDWKSWGEGLGVGPAGGQYTINYIFFAITAIAFAGTASFLTKRYAIYARHSGIPEIKTLLGGFVIRRFLGGWTLLIKSLGLCLAVSSGLWLGKEGPLVHVACCCASLLMKPFAAINRNEARKREVFSAAAAAGISVAFGAPLGGVLFSLEQLSYYFPDKTMWQSFVCAMIAAFAVKISNPFRTGQTVVYQVTYTTGWFAFELVPFIMLGILGGIYGGIFIKANLKIAQWRKSTFINQWPVIEVLIIAAITAILSYPNKYLRAQYSELVQVLFEECTENKEDLFGVCGSGAISALAVVNLIAASIVGFCLTTITFGTCIPAGIILPSMAIGALYGRAVGIIVEATQMHFANSFIFRDCPSGESCVTPGTYAIIGAAAALGGATRMTVSIVVIMFELTGALDYVLPIMIAVMLSKWIGDAFGKKSIYEAWIDEKEYPFLGNRDEAIAPDFDAQQFMTPLQDLTTITTSGHTLQSLRDLINRHQYRGYPIVSDDNESTLAGYILRAELVNALEFARSAPRSHHPNTEVFFSQQRHADPLNTINFRPWMDQTPITLNVHARMHLTIEMFQKLGLKYILFTEGGSLSGILTKKDIWYIVNGHESGAYDRFDSRQNSRSADSGDTLFAMEDDYGDEDRM